MKMYSKIQNRHKILSKTRIMSDKEIIENFADEVDVPPNLMMKKSSNFFNLIVNKLSKKTKKIIFDS